MHSVAGVSAHARTSLDSPSSRVPTPPPTNAPVAVSISAPLIEWLRISSPSAVASCPAQAQREDVVGTHMGWFWIFSTVERSGEGVLAHAVYTSSLARIGEEDSAGRGADRGCMLGRARCEMGNSAHLCFDILERKERPF
jgi:hypothetical protein